MVGRRTLRRAANSSGTMSDRVHSGIRLSDTDDIREFKHDLHDVRKTVMDKFGPYDERGVSKCDDLKSRRKGSHAKGSIVYTTFGMNNSEFPKERKQTTNKVKKPILTKRKTVVKRKPVTRGRK